MSGQEMTDRPRAEATQTASDADESAERADAQATDGDEHAEARDQAASDRQPSASSTLARTREASRRDEAARLGDARALARDRLTDASDRAAEQQEAALGNGAGRGAAGRELREAAAALRASAASDRARAATDRTVAADDRAVAADDRAMAAADRAMAAEDRARAVDDRARAGGARTRAAEDREQAHVDLRHAHLDGLTGVLTRSFGLAKMQHEVDRARRTKQPFVLAFVDVDGLKQINDREGHAAGDAALRAVGAALVSGLRSYDLIVRVGGDEFLCGFADTDRQAAAARIEEIQATLGRGEDGVSISSGLAELRPGESLQHLTARGDEELYQAKNGA